MLFSALRINLKIRVEGTAVLDHGGDNADEFVLDIVQCHLRLLPSGQKPPVVFSYDGVETDSAESTAASFFSFEKSIPTNKFFIPMFLILAGLVNSCMDFHSKEASSQSIRLQN